MSSPLSSDSVALLLTVRGARESFFPNPMAAALFDERYSRGRFKVLPFHVVGRGSCEGYFVFDKIAGKRASETGPLEEVAKELERLAAAEKAAP